MIGYQVTTVTPPNIAPSAQAVFPSTRIFPRVASIRRIAYGSRFSRVAACSKPARAAARFRSRAFAFFPNCFAIAASTSAISIERSRARTPTYATFRRSLRSFASEASGSTSRSNGTG